MANKRFNQITRVVTSFDSNDVLPIGNGTLGDGKMSKDTLLELTAQNALAGNVAPAFDPTKPNDAGGYAYYIGEGVVYNGAYYKFKQNKTSGTWDSSKVTRIDLDAVLVTKVDSDYFNKFGNETSFAIDRLNREVSESSSASVVLATIENYGISYAAPQAIEISNGRTLKFFKVTQGEKFNVTATSDSYLRLGYTANYPTPGEAITDFATAISYDVTLTAPITGYFVISNIVANDTTFDVSVTEVNEGLGADVVKLKNDVQEIDSALFYEKVTQKSPDDRHEDYYINTSGTIVSFPSPNIYDVLALDVVAGETYTVKGVSQAGGAALCYAVYSTNELENMDADHAVLISTKTCAEGSYELELTIPEGGVCLAATATYGTGVTFFKKEVVAKTADITNLEKTCIEYSLNSNTINVRTTSGTKSLVVQFGVQSIGNNLFDLLSLAKLNKTDPLDSSLFTDLSQSSSDWIGPFQVAAVANKDGDDTGSGSGYDEDGFKITFTGGAHRYNNTTTGSTATARLSDLEFRINGEAITQGSGFASKIEISWINNIQAYNTKKADGTGREVLKEHCKLTFDGLDWKVGIELEPLEDISIRTWYGLQMTGVSGSTSTHWKYVDAANRGADASSSGNNSTKAVIAYGGKYEVEMWLDTSIDLGKRWLCYSGITNSAFHSGSKLYFMLGNDYSPQNYLTLGNFYYLFGKYKFSIPTV